MNIMRGVSCFALRRQCIIKARPTQETPTLPGLGQVMDLFLEVWQFRQTKKNSYILRSVYATRRGTQVCPRTVSP